MFGSHLSIAGSMTGALDAAAKLRMDTVQVFTKNQQQWKVRELDDASITQWKTRVAALGWEGRTVAHASYLINLASPDDALWAKSVDLMQVEIERCEALGIPFLVHHPGASTTSTPEAGLDRIVAAYRELFTRTRGCKTVSCLENTVGGGSVLGREFEQLADLRARIIDATGQPDRVGFCFDTCHAHAGGYDLSTAGGAEAALERWDSTCSLGAIRVLHLNDSKGQAGSRLDRHEHIGQGTIGREGFKALLRRPEFDSVPKILETPKGTDNRGRDCDAVNLACLWRLSERRPIKGPIKGSTRFPGSARAGVVSAIVDASITDKLPKSPAIPPARQLRPAGTARRRGTA